MEAFLKMAKTNVLPSFFRRFTDAPNSVSGLRICSISGVDRFSSNPMTSRMCDGKLVSVHAGSSCGVGLKEGLGSEACCWGGSLG